MSNTDRLPIVLRPAKQHDAQAIFNCVNAAYSLEIGDSGVAFKKTNRYNDVKEVEKDIEDNQTRFIVAEQDKLVVGCCRMFVCLSLCEEKEYRIDFGPFAVLPDKQGKGIGHLLFQEVKKFAAQHNNLKAIEIEVVNHRTDLFDVYTHWGFKKVSTAPCDLEHNCDASKLTRPSHFVIFRCPIDFS